ncbi:MAG: phospholipase D-like domain-containing protein [Dehalococcoidia bacterium]
MKVKRLVITLSILLALSLPCWAADVQVWFSPPIPGQTLTCEDALVTEISNAKSSIWIQMFNFEEVPVAQALVNAHGRGVDVQVIMDSKAMHQKAYVGPILAKGIIPVWSDSRHNIAHNKVAIIDQAEVFTGSYNWSPNALNHNAENLVLIKNDPDTVAKYIQNFKIHQLHSVKGE